MSSTVRLRRAERKKTILAAASRVFVRDGFAAATMDAIAGEAGITKAILYRHYESKQDLYEAVLRDARERVRAAVTGAGEAEDQAPPPSLALKRLLQAARQDPDGFALLFQKTLREPGEMELPGLSMSPLDTPLARWINDHVMLRWTMQFIRPLIIQAFLVWLQVGDRERDEEFLARLQSLVGAMVRPRPVPDATPKGE